MTSKKSVFEKTTSNKSTLEKKTSKKSTLKKIRFRKKDRQKVHFRIFCQKILSENVSSFESEQCDRQSDESETYKNEPKRRPSIEKLHVKSHRGGKRRTK